LAEQQKENTVNVLLVDDDTSLLQVAELILKDMDKTLVIETATNVETAYKRLAEKNIDIIVSDYEMPNRNGLDFITELREKDIKLPFILFTGKGREEIAIKALNLGVDRYLNKIGDPETVYKELVISIHQLHGRAKAQNMLQENEERLRLLIDFSPDPVVLLDDKGVILDINRQTEALLGFTKSELIGKSMVTTGIVPAETMQNMSSDFFETVAGHTVNSIEYKLKRKDGEYVFVEISAFPLKRSDKIEILSIARDITHRKNAEAELEQKYEILERVTKSIDSGLAIIGKDYRVVWANSILQTKIADRNKHCYQLFNNLETICPDCGVQKIFEQNASIDVHEFQFIDSHGKPMWVELRVTPLKGKNDEVIGAIELAVPITQRKKAEQELRESEERFAKLSSTTYEGILISRNGVILDANNQFAKFHQYEVSEIVGKPVLMLVAPKDREIVKNNMSSGFEGPYEVFALRKDGSTFPVEVRAKSMNYKGYTARVSAVLDITERKKAEAKFTSINEKLRVVGKLTRHDVRNKLTTISSNTYLLRKRCGNNPEIAKYLDSIDSAVALSNRLFDFTAVYEKIGVQEQTEIDVKSCFDEAVALFANIGAIQVINEAQGLVVVADSLLRQIFYNLVDNSLRHGKAVTQIRLHYVRDQKCIKLYYEDNGVGVPFEDKQKIFIEHYSTNGGTGLGMSTIRKIMDVYNWTIEETGVPNQGVRFEINIPVVTGN
jgi:PAS domain S-box-containing protein